MANSTQDDIQLLLSRHKFTMVEEGNENLFCTLCKNVMFDPYQTYCGCLFCCSCIINYLSNGEIYCCGTKSECKDEYLVLDVNVNRNFLFNRKIQKAKVFCPNRSCSHTSNLAEMKDHLRICTKQAVECPYLTIGCNYERDSKDQILNHLHNEALPHAQMLIDLIHDLRNEVGVLQNNFESIKKESEEKEIRIATLEYESRERETEANKQKEEIEALKTNVRDTEVKVNAQQIEIQSMKRRLDEEKDRQIALEEEHRSKEMKLKEMEVDLRNKEVKELQIEMKSVKNNEERGKNINEETYSQKNEIKELQIEMKSMKNNEEERVKKINEEIHTQKKLLENQANEIDTMKKGMKDAEIKQNKQITNMTSLERNIDAVKNSGDDTRARIDGLSKAVDLIDIRTNMTGEIFLEVEEFKKLSKSTDERRIHSQYFYSHLNGYKLRLIVFPGGCDDGSGTHLSVAILICKGEYDTLLEWPCKYIFSVALVDPLTWKTHYKMTLSHDTAPDYGKYCYDKPKNIDNDFYGYDIISHWDLRSTEGLLVEDAIILKCTATPPYK